MNELQQAYTQFAEAMPDGKETKMLRDIDAVMLAPAATLLARAGLAGTTEPFRLLDQACGSGPLVAQLQRAVDPGVLARSRVRCTDVNEAMLGVLRRRAAAERWVGDVDVAFGNAQDSKFPDGSFTHVTINFGLHVIPKPEEVLKDTFRILEPGGMFAFSTMHTDNQGWVPDTRSAFKAISSELFLPDPVPMASNGKTEWTNPSRIEEMLRENGFEDIRVELFLHNQRMESGEHFATAFTMMFNWMAMSFWTEEQREKYQASLGHSIAKHLDEKHGGKGWDLPWTMILATCRKPSL